MNTETANYYANVLRSLADAEAQFELNKDNIRVMDDCREKLKALSDLQLPDAVAHPELHAYMAKLHHARAEDQRKLSPEGRRLERLRQIEELRGSLRDYERHYMVCVSEAANYTAKAESAKKRMELTKSVLTDLEAEESTQDVLNVV